MNWRSSAFILAAFVAAAITIWFAPLLLDPLRLGEFGLIGRLVFPILALSALEVVFHFVPDGQQNKPAGEP
jgi:predicted transporter